MKTLIKSLFMAAALGLWASVASANSISGYVVCIDTDPTTRLGGVTVTIKGTLQTFTAVTASDGAYFVQFDATDVDTYTVTIQTPAGLSIVSPASGNYVLSIDPNSSNTHFNDANFSLTGCVQSPPRGSIGDTVYCDTNGNGVQDPGELGISGVKVVLLKANGDVVASATTDVNGHYLFSNLIVGEYIVEVDVSSVPDTCSVPVCDIVVPVTLGAGENFLDADFCFTPPPPPGPGPCWLTGGGTIGKTRKVANYSFGGVVYPGCSPRAADGGNWNVINHFEGLHFQGQHIVVDSCSGVHTRSPRVDVNIIDFHGEGIIGGIGGNPALTVPVTFVGRAVDNQEPGGGNDLLYLSVSDGSTIVLQIGNSVADPATISTGNLQIHTSSCPSD